MVCPNCHSDQIIAVQDQHFCINCGQAVPDVAGTKATLTTSAVPIQENGLPEGVEILPITAPPEGLIKTRSRLSTFAADVPAKLKKRKAGRPKNGRLDTPLSLGTVVAAPLPNAPALTPHEVPAAPGPKPLPGPHRMNDIAPRRPAHRPAHTPQNRADHKHKLNKEPIVKKKTPKVHKLAVPPLHYGSVINFSLRARVRPRLLGLAALAAIGFSIAIGYSVWILLTGGLSSLANGLMQSRTPLIIELGLLAVIYYVGRSIGQSAITYGVIRETDQRPISLTRQLGVAINSFMRRLALDLSLGFVEVFLLCVIGVLITVGGSTWPVGGDYQFIALFGSFLLLLYLLTSLALTRGLAGVAITLTNQSAWDAAALGWKLFSHRFELLGLRFLALALELLLIIPLAALAAAFVATAKPGLYLPVALGVGLLAWVSGALLGAGTAAWWAALYRNLVMADRPDGALSLLSGRPSGDANSGPLAFVVSLSTLLIAAVIALPWLKFF